MKKQNVSVAHEHNTNHDSENQIRPNTRFRHASLAIRPDMPLDQRNERQDCEVKYLDRILMEAFTARTAREVRCAESSLRDIQEQCLGHIRFLSEIESFYRTTVEQVQFDQDEEGYNELISFLAGVGASLAGVTHQLGFKGAMYEPARPHPFTKAYEPLSLTRCQDNDGMHMAQVRNFPGASDGMYPADMEKMAEELLQAAQTIRAA